MNIKITQAQTGPGGANTYIVKDDDSGKGFMVDLTLKSVQQNFTEAA